MQELFVLVEEHEAVRRRLDQVEAALTALRRHDAGARERMVNALKDTVVLVRDIHQPKEEAVFIPRIGGKSGIQKTVLDAAMREEHRLVEKLGEVMDRFESGALVDPVMLGVELIPVLSAMRNAMDWEDQVLYPSAYSNCNEQDLWDLSVALDRAVDVAGRQLRENMIAPMVQSLRVRAAEATF